jgi:hypothetical protein
MARPGKGGGLVRGMYFEKAPTEGLKPPGRDRGEVAPSKTSWEWGCRKHF